MPTVQSPIGPAGSQPLDGKAARCKSTNQAVDRVVPAQRNQRPLVTEGECRHRLPDEALAQRTGQPANFLLRGLRVRRRDGLARSHTTTGAIVDGKHIVVRRGQQRRSDHEPTHAIEFQSIEPLQYIRALNPGGPDGDVGMQHLSASEHDVVTGSACIVALSEIGSLAGKVWSRASSSNS